MLASRARALAALLCASALCGCATLWQLGLRPPDGGRVCPGPLVPSEQLPQDLLLRAQLHLRAEGVDTRLTLIARTRAGELVLVGLDGFGSRLFGLRQRGVEVAVERSYGRALPWPPQNLLRDLHAIRFLALPGAPLADGTQRGTVAGIEVEERWFAGRLEQRQIARAEAGELEIAAAPDGRGFELRNRSCGHEASYVILEESSR